MRKPIVALGLVVSTSLGVIPVADALAATPTGSNLSLTPPSSSLSSKNTPPRFTTYPSPGATATANNVTGAAIIATALKYLGYPYTATGNSPATGFSCIGFVSYVYHVNGIPLPGDLQDAYDYAPQVPFSDLQPGDILYFQNTVWPGISHAAIYLGGGRFVHSEYYGVGVRITSFYNDPKDGSTYWISKYLGANRPWGGANVDPVVSSSAPTGGAATTTAPTVASQTRIATGPTAVISTPVHVRLHPSMGAGVQTVATPGTDVVILKKRGNWYKVQLPDGTIGWIVAAGIGQAAPATTAVSGSGSVAPTIGNPTAPQRQGAPVRASRLSTRVNAAILRVHSAPSLLASVTTTVYRGEHLKVLARANGWMKVILPDGTVGWVSSQYVRSQSRKSAPTYAGNRTSSRTYSGSAAIKARQLSGGSTTRVALNVHLGPALGDAVITVISPGGSYRVLGWSNGWAHVQLAGGQTGWVSGTVLGRPSSTYRAPGSRRSIGHTFNAVAASGHVLTAGVRVHAAPGLRSRVVGLAAAGTHVMILGYQAGWVLVRLPNGQTGYVDGVYVR